MTSPLHHWFFICALSLLFAICTDKPLSAQPANDDCVNAIEVVDGVYPGSSLLSTNDGFGFCGASASDVWYKFVAPYNGLLIAHVCVSANFDTVVGIWNGCPNEGGAEIDCNDDACGMQRSSVDVAITASQEYYIRVAGYEGDSGNFTLTVISSEFSNPAGPDVVLSEMQDIASFPPVGNTHAYITDTHTCNVGDTSLSWGGTPLMTWNAYRLFGGRFEQIGLSWVKSGVAANAGPGCGQVCQGDSGSLLGAGCKDVYGSNFNADQGLLGPRSDVNAFTGNFGGASGTCSPGDSICKRLQIAESDLDPTLYPDALYFFEVVYVAVDDALAGNYLNNASHKRVAVDENFSVTPAGPIEVGKAAIEAWRLHGFGVNTPDPDVVLGQFEVSSEGTFKFAYRVRELGGGQWRYEYAIYNLNSHQAGASFSVPKPPSVSVSDLSFHDVAYHSGEPFDGTDWAGTVASNSVTWSVTQTFAQNPNANALRYGTLYNFGFTATSGPEQNVATLGLFRPGDSDSVTALMAAPGTPMVLCQMVGDINQDFQIDASDVQHFVDCATHGFSSGGDCNCADMDASTVIDDFDTFLFVDALLTQ